MLNMRNSRLVFALCIHALKHKNIFSMKFIVLLFTGCFISVTLVAQINYHEIGRKQLYYGISLGMNAGDLNVKRKKISSLNDSIATIDSKFGPGFNIGIIGNWQFSKYFDLRLIPSLVFTERNLIYTSRNGSEDIKNIPSIYISVPLLLRIKAEPINDFRFYVIGGLRYDYDMASKKGNFINPEEIKMERNDLSLEYGVGFQVFFPYFILAPEFKMSHSLFNVKAEEQSQRNNNLIDRLLQRTFTILINFEG